MPYMKEKVESITGTGKWKPGTSANTISTFIRHASEELETSVAQELPRQQHPDGPGWCWQGPAPSLLSSHRLLAIATLTGLGARRCLRSPVPAHYLSEEGRLTTSAAPLPRQMSLRCPPKARGHGALSSLVFFFVKPAATFSAHTI